MLKFAERLREVLEVNKISQAELARKVGMAQSTVNKYCAGKKEPSLKVLFAICQALDESADYLLGLTD